MGNGQKNIVFFPFLFFLYFFCCFLIFLIFLLFFKWLHLASSSFKKTHLLGNVSVHISVPLSLSEKSKAEGMARGGCRGGTRPREERTGGLTSRNPRVTVSGPARRLFLRGACFRSAENKCRFQKKPLGLGFPGPREPRRPFSGQRRGSPARLRPEPAHVRTRCSSFSERSEPS